MTTAEKNNQQNCDFKKDIATYFKGVKAEWSKVSWPTRKQVVGETVIVLCVVTFFTVIVFLMDKLFIWLLGKI